MLIGYYYVFFMILYCFIAWKGSDYISEWLGFPKYAIYDEERGLGLRTAKNSIIRGLVCITSILLFLVLIFFIEPDSFHFRNWCLLMVPILLPLSIFTFLLIVRADFYNDERGEQVLGADFYNFPVSHIDVLEKIIGISCMPLVFISFLFMMPDEWGIPFVPKCIALLSFIAVNSVLFYPSTLEKHFGDFRTKKGIGLVYVWRFISLIVPITISIIVLLSPLIMGKLFG